MDDSLFTRRSVVGLVGALAATSAGAQRPGDATGTTRPQRFAGKVVLVTGATSGMGAVTARALALEGGNVFICGRRAEKGAEVEKSIRDAGGDVTFVQADVTNEAQVKALLKTIETRHGRLDCAFNNVGTADGTGQLHELSTEDFDLVMNTNLRGNYLQIKYEVPLMLRNGGGVIVGNSSIAGLRYLPAKAHYSGAKHGVIGMYGAAALDYAKQKIRFNVVCPGLIMTEKAQRVIGEDEARYTADIPMGTIGESADVAAMVLWLFSDEARYVTGAMLPVDGGQSVA